MTPTAGGAVPRGTDRPPPAAYELLGRRAEVLVPYARLLATEGISRGLLGPREAPRLWERHLLNCAAPLRALAPGSAVVDVGTGAGLPGLVWALLRPDLRVSLVEPLLRRAAFCEQAVQSLGLAGVQVRRSRGEELGESAADVVVARAVAPLDRLARWCLPLARPGGGLWALKGQSAAEEVEKSRAALQRAGAVDVRVATYGVHVLQPPTTVVHVTRGDHPRRGGRP